MSEPAALEHHILPVLNHLARISARAADAALAPTGLRPRHLVALMLLRDHGPVSQQELIEGLSLDPSNVVALLNELEERELVTRRRDPADRRRHIVAISTRGDQQLLDAQQCLSRTEDDLFRALTPQERIILHGLLLRASGTQFSAVSSCAAVDEPPVDELTADDCPGVA